MNIYFFFVIIFLIIFLGIIFLFIFRKKKFSGDQTLRIARRIESTKNLDPEHSILKSHKIFVNSLNLLLNKKNLTAAQTIKFFSKRLPNIQKIWYYHGLRNKIAHELDTKVSEEQAEYARKNFIFAIKSLEVV